MKPVSIVPFMMMTPTSVHNGTTVYTDIPHMQGTRLVHTGLGYSKTSTDEYSVLITVSAHVSRRRRSLNPRGNKKRNQDRSE